MRITFGLALAVALSGPVLAQQGTPNAIQMTKAEGLEVRYLNFGWNPEGFAAMESGGAHPLAGRSWLLARLDPSQPLKWLGKTIPAPCGCLLVLNPAAQGAPMTLEVRQVDLSNVWTNLNLIATPPEGTTLHKAPAAFKKVPTAAARLGMDLKPAEGKLLLSVHYGDRETTIELTR